MREIRKILAPVDFSGPSQAAVRQAWSLAAAFDVPLVIAHVVPFLSALIYAYPHQRPALEPSRAEAIKERMRAMIAPDHRAAVQVRYVLSSGDVRDELRAIAAAESADLIVMGASGLRPFERWLLGSTAEGMLRRSEVPIMMVSRPEADDSRPVSLRRILYATDLSDDAGDALALAVELARRFSAELRIVHVMEDIRRVYGVGLPPSPADDETAKLRSDLVGRLEAVVPAALRSDPRVRTELREGRPYEEILEAAEGGQADLIVLNTRSRSALERALLGTTAERVIRGAAMPVLSVPPARQ